MPRYFFHVRNGIDLKRDEEGATLADVEAARAVALADAKQMLADHLRTGAPLSAALDQVVEVVDDAGTTVLEVSFMDAAETDIPAP